MTSLKRRSQNTVLKAMRNTVTKMKRPKVVMKKRLKRRSQNTVTTVTTMLRLMINPRGPKRMLFLTLMLVIATS